MKPFVVFDLDGTLIDGYAGIGEALSYAMERLGLARPAPDSVRVMVGHGLEKLLEKAVGPDLAPEGVRLFRERYPQVAVEKTELLPGVPEVLGQLAARGHAMTVASNKPAQFSRLILEAKGVADYFASIEGPDAETPAKPDPTMLLRLMKRLRRRPDGTVVVGDMEVDVEMARAAGCRVVLVPGGSQPREELEKLGADALLERLANLPEWLESSLEPKR
ncbi:MAG TPA: HAD family hydrolase [Thermoanaerobaculia bacterium]|nr:HAD family hydrolase [Thermoanaerobaculia bacterium]